MFSLLSKKNNFPLNFFKKVSNNVKAYKKFLIDHNINYKDIHSIDDFLNKVPVMNKDNYLRRYPLVELVEDGVIPPMVSVSSGSSGKPFYWPRGEEQEIEGGKLHERVFRNIFNIENKRTLVVVCFSMGNWIAGTFTASSCRYVSKQKDMNISVITPGIEKEDILFIFQEFAQNFEVVVLAGYPPFLMDIVIELKKRNIDISKFSLKFLFAGEGFSEQWRNLICDFVGIKNSLVDTTSVYGTADAGALGHENPLTIYIRKKASENKEFKEALFGDIGFVPSLVQFDPSVIYFESINNSLAFTTNSGIPLIRYDIKDNGVVLEMNTISNIAKKFDFFEEFSSYAYSWNYPVVALFGRSDVSITFYALNIYPENIKAALEQEKFLSKVTGKFLARVDSNDEQTEQKLVISVELSENISSEDFYLKEDITKELFKSLTSLNAEYRKLYNAISDKALPNIEMVSFGNDIFKLKKNKQNWINKK